MNKRRFIGRSVGVSLLSVSLAVVLASSVLATGANTTPETQSHGHGVSSSWTISWNGTAPLDWRFDTNINVTDYPNPHWTGTAGAPGGTSKSTAWYPCVATTFQQKLRVIDKNDVVAVDYTTATEGGGNPC